MNKEIIQTLVMVIVVCLSAFSALLVLLLWHYRKLMYKQRYNAEKSRAELENFRASLENRIYQLTDRLLVSEDRWRDVNHLLISAQKVERKLPTEPKKVYLGEFLRANGVVEEDLGIDKELVFVLTPFHKKYEDVFKIIGNVCRDIHLRCLRGDEENIRGDIFGHILRLMVRARLVIANIDGRNPNVFYELGIAQAMNKGLILVSSSLRELPVDLVGKRMIVFESLLDLEAKLKDELTKALIKT